MCPCLNTILYSKIFILFFFKSRVIFWLMIYIFLLDLAGNFIFTSFIHKTEKRRSGYYGGSYATCLLRLHIVQIYALCVF